MAREQASDELMIVLDPSEVGGRKDDDDDDGGAKKKKKKKQQQHHHHHHQRHTWKQRRGDKTVRRVEGQGR